MRIKKGLLLLFLVLALMPLYSLAQSFSYSTLSNLGIPSNAAFLVWKTAWITYYSETASRWSNWQEVNVIKRIDNVPQYARQGESWVQFNNWIQSDWNVEVEYPSTPSSPSSLSEYFPRAYIATYLCCNGGGCPANLDTILHREGRMVYGDWRCGWRMAERYIPSPRIENGRCNRFVIADRGHVCGLSSSDPYTGRKPAVLNCETAGNVERWRISEIGGVNAVCNANDICVAADYASTNIADTDLRRLDHVTADVFMRMNNIYRSSNSGSTGYTSNNPKYGFGLQLTSGAWAFACIPIDTCGPNGPRGEANFNEGRCFNYPADSANYNIQYPGEANPVVRGQWAGICKRVVSPTTTGSQTRYGYVPDYENNPAGSSGVDSNYHGKCNNRCEETTTTDGRTIARCVP